jgi:outer membrane protein, heavy metal efflux system
MPSRHWDRVKDARSYPQPCSGASDGFGERAFGPVAVCAATKVGRLTACGAILVVAAVALSQSAALAQVSTPAMPQVGSPTIGPPPPLLMQADETSLPLLVPPTQPIPANLTLEQALLEAEARSPAIAAAQANVAAARGRLRQAGFRDNPELSVEVENFLGRGELSGLQGTEVTVAVNQRLDLGGRRSARQSVGRAELAVSELRLLITRAELALNVRQQFATAVAARERLRIATENEQRSRELARIANVLVEVGREPPLRALRAQAAASQAAADLRAAQAGEAVSRRTLAALFGVEAPPESVAGSLTDILPTATSPVESLDVRLANAQLALAEASLQQQLTERRLDPAVGVGIRHVQETGDQALVAGFSMPLPIRNRNQGNIEAARAEILAAEAERASARVSANARVANATANLTAASARVEALEEGAIPEGREALRLAQLSYEAGKIELIELLDAQAALTGAETQLIEARLAQAEAAGELARATAQ